jgi:hypothetical protein
VVFGIDKSRSSEEKIVEKINYHSFLIRLWLVNQKGDFSWRVSLEDPHSGQQEYFNTYEDFVTFIQQLKSSLETHIDKK